MHSRRIQLLIAVLVGIGLLVYACTPAGDRTRFEEAAPPTQPSVTTSTTTEVPDEKPVEQVAWQPLDEPGVGGHVTALAIDPTDSDRILVGGDLIGVGLTVDGGQTWEPTYGLTNAEMAQFTFHPTNGQEVWVGTMGGPFVSLDSGRTWSLRRAGMGDLLDIGYSAPIEKVLVDPANPDRLLAFGGSHREWNSPGTKGWGIVWESVDHGTSWSNIATLADATNVVDAVWLADGSLLAAALGRGVFRSTDGGHSWVPDDAGLPHTDVRALAAHPTDPLIVWAALGSMDTGDGVVGGGVWKSLDGGLNWQPSSTGLDLVNTQGTGTFYAPRYHVIAVAPSDPNLLLTSNLAYGAEAVFRSTDGGATWAEVVGSRSIARPITAYNTPISATAVVFDPSNAQRALVGNAEFVLATENGGLRWQDITSDVASDGTSSGRGFSGLVANRAIYSPDGSELLLCGFDGANPLLSQDGGVAWRRPLVTSNPWGGCLDAAYSATQPDRRYVLLGQNSNFGGLAIIGPDGSFAVVAGAGTGLPERNTKVGQLGAVEVVSRSDGSELVAVALGNSGVYLSSDNGATFALFAPEIGAGELVADASVPGRLYAAGVGGVWYSDDGAGFAPLGGSPRQAVRLTLDPATAFVYAAVWRTEDAGLWRWDGAAWTQILAEPSAHDVAVDPTNPQHLLVATNDHPFHDTIASVGVLQSFDGGASWTEFNSGLPMLRVSTVAFDPAQAGRAVIGTFGRGFFTTSDASP